MKEFKCIVCDKSIKPLDLGDYDTEDFVQNMWDGGTVDKLYMPYGSRFDSNVYIFGLCDDCVEKKHKEGIILLKGEY